MADLSQIDKRILENMFEMKSGYVLDFTDATFEEFFRTTVSLNIYDEKYKIHGTSKAKRLRAFWEIEDNQTVLKVLSELFELWRHLKEKDKSDSQYQDGLDIINKLEIPRKQGVPKKMQTEDVSFSLFISHRDKDKVLANEIKQHLEFYGVSSFVAHEDIEPSEEWIKTIEAKLFSMDALLALLTDGFSSSVWTNQEVGVAYGRGVFILSVRLGEDPKGFVGKFQALRPKANDAKVLSQQIVKHLLSNDKTKDKMIDTYFDSLKDKFNYAASEEWTTPINAIKEISNEQAEKLVKIYNENSQAYDCYVLNGSKDNRELSDRINEWLGKEKYKMSNRKIIE